MRICCERGELQLIKLLLCMRKKINSFNTQDLKCGRYGLCEFALGEHLVHQITFL